MSKESGGVGVHEVGETSRWPVLLGAAARGDAAAWKEIVDRNCELVWAVPRAHRLDRADADDVCQATWLLLAENLERLRNPEALPAWLATTARHETLRLIKVRKRETPAGLDGAGLEIPEPAEGPETKALRSLLIERMAEAFAALSHRCQQLRVVAMAPDASYAQISKAMGVAMGTIGPKKARCLAELRKQMASPDMPEEAAG